MTSSFGDRLRLQREQRQIALATIADQTKIKLSLLEALERDDLRHWPLGIFGRSYIRSYALRPRFASSSSVIPARSKPPLSRCRRSRR